MYKPRPKRPIADRFWSKVKKNDDSCWIWTATKNPAGYGLISAGSFGSAPLKAHRVSWELHFGKILDDKIICHKCDNPSCVRPDHLFVGTHKDNVDDMFKKGRANRTRMLFQITRPDGAIIVRIGLPQFAEENGLHKNTLNRLVRNERKQAKGFRNLVALGYIRSSFQRNGL